MTKQDFTIEGSEALKKAFVEECGVPTLSKESLTRNYLCPTSDNKSLQSSGAYKLPKHFVLPKDWDSALEYVKEFFKEEEIKKGDYVVVLSKKSYNYGHSSGNEKPVIGRTYEVTNTIGNLINLYSPTGWIRIDAEELRKATPEEIKASKTVSFKLGEHTAVVTKDKVEIAGRGSVSISECIEWFQKEFIADNDDYSSLGEFVVKENTYTLDIGCVKNVPVKDIEALYKYLKTL